MDGVIGTLSPVPALAPTDSSVKTLNALAEVFGKNEIRRIGPQFSKLCLLTSAESSSRKTLLRGVGSIPRFSFGSGVDRNSASTDGPLGAPNARKASSTCCMICKYSAFNPVESDYSGVGELGDETIGYL